MKRLIAVAGLVLMVGCQAPRTEMTEADVAEIESIVRGQAEALVTTQNAMDAEAFLAYFSRENLEWVNIANHYGSFEAVDRMIRSVIGRLDAFDSGWNELGVTVLSKRAALSHGNWWGKQFEGNLVHTGDAIYWTALHELEEDGSWRITRVHQSWNDLVTEEAG